MQLEQFDIHRVRDVSLPEYGSAQAAALDMRAAIDQPIQLEPNERKRVPTGVRIDLRGFCGLLLPRSGKACKQGLTLANTPGLIDPDYKDEIEACLFNISNESLTIEPNEKIAQLMIMPFVRVSDWHETEQLGGVDRGGGFGSTDG